MAFHDSIEMFIGRGMAKYRVHVWPKLQYDSLNDLHLYIAVNTNIANTTWNVKSKLQSNMDTF
jgi:hypothetical protein